MRAPRAKAVAKVKVVAPKKQEEELAGAAYVFSDEDSEAPLKRRRLQRRDTEDAAERVMVEKLYPYYEKSYLQGLRNKSGDSPRQVIAAELHVLRPKKKNLTTKFWSNFFTMFPLKMGAVGLLADPPEGLGFADALVDALASAHNDNPAKRCPQDFISLLQTLDGLNEFEFHGVVAAIDESAKVKKCMALKMQMAFLQFVSRTY